MPLLHIFILALVQGVTEFLPISSSGHLVLIHEFLEETKSFQEDLMLDVSVHVGTLASVLVYFRRDVMKILCLLCWVKGQKDKEGAQLALFILVSSLPVITVGYAIHIAQPGWLRSLEVMAWTTLIFGALLWWVDKIKPEEKTLDNLCLRSALWIGLAQVLALIPGTSRSGITMTAARWFGFSRTEAAHYSLLLAIVAISGAGTLSGLSLMESDNMDLTFDVLIAAALAFISGLAAIALMMKWLEKASFAIFAGYRVLLGLALLGLLYSGVLV